MAEADLSLGALERVSKAVEKANTDKGTVVGIIGEQTNKLLTDIYDESVSQGDGIREVTEKGLSDEEKREKEKAKKEAEDDKKKDG
jgi:hypothetical protein